MTRSAFSMLVALPAVLAAAQPASAPAAPSHVPGLPTAERQHRCPVVPGELVSPRGPLVRYRGIKVYFSSLEALHKWNLSPAAYIDVRVLPQLKGLTLPARPIAQIYCPVYRDRKVSHYDPYIVHQGVKVYFYDEHARQRWLANTEKYLDPEWLPQFRGAEVEAEAVDAELEGLLVQPASEADEDAANEAPNAGPIVP
jgi:hypothetical protein